MTSRRTLLISAITGLPAIAAEFWNTKDPSEWSEKDAQRLLTNSPWAKQVAVTMGARNMGGPGSGPGGGGGGRGGRGGGGGGMGGMGGGGMDASASGTGGPGGGGMGGGGGRGGMGGGGAEGMGGGPGGGMGGGGMGAPEIRAMVRWETSMAIRDAGKKPQMAEAADFYVLTVSGLPMGGGMMGGGRERKAEEGSPEERRKKMEEMLKQSTMLQRKGKDPIYADKVIRPEGGRAIYFLFSRKADPIKPEDKEVIFACKMGPMEIKAKFVLKEMMYKGQLAA